MAEVKYYSSTLTEPVTFSTKTMPNKLCSPKLIGIEIFEYLKI